MRMKAILAVTALFVATSISLSAVVSANGVDQILNNMQNAAKSIKTLQADLNQVTNHSIGGKSKYDGTVIFQRGTAPGSEKAIVKYTNGQQVSVIGDAISIAQPNLGQLLKASRSKLAADNNEVSFIATPFASTSSLK